MALEIKVPSLVTVSGRSMAYDEIVPPDPRGTILLLTGLTSKRLGWYRQMPVFGQQYRTIALDHRDIGDSDPFESQYSTADQADDAASVLRALGVERAHIIGISMGGYISLELTLRHPDLVDHLLLTSTSAGGATHMQPAPESGAMLVQAANTDMEIGELARRTYAIIMAPGYCESHPSDWDHIAEVARYRPQSRESYMRQLRACLMHDVSARLGEIHAPTLVIHGELDPLIPVGNGRYLAEHIPGARLILYPDTGHVPIIERADEYNRDVLAFLAS